MLKRLMSLAMAASALILAPAACMRAGKSDAALGPSAADGEIGARPVQAGAGGKAGQHSLSAGTILYVPPNYDAGRPAPLVVMLHGAGGSAEHSINLGKAHADRLGIILMAPQSRASSWDIISSRRYGADVRTIDRQLQQLFSVYSIDPDHVAVAGFSDGASYALSLGLINGDLFTHVLAFSPGFMAPTETKGLPRIFISHGTDDRVLPIDVCSRKLVPRLKAGGYVVDYREFRGGHVVPPELARGAFDALAGSST